MFRKTVERKGVTFCEWLKKEDEIDFVLTAFYWRRSERGMDYWVTINYEWQGICDGESS